MDAPYSLSFFPCAFPLGSATLAACPPFPLLVDPPSLQALVSALSRPRRAAFYYSFLLPRFLFVVSGKLSLFLFSFPFSSSRAAPCAAPLLWFNGPFPFRRFQAVASNRR